MYVRLVSLSGASPDKRDNMVQTMRENVLPTLRGYDGFAGYVGLHDPDSEQAKGIIFFESKEAAEAAEETLAERRQRMAGGVGLTIESAELFEAPVIDVDGVRG
jgi:hypothetical protein